MSLTSDFEAILLPLDEIDSAISSKNATLSLALERLRNIEEEVAHETAEMDKLRRERVEVIQKIKTSMEALFASREITPTQRTVKTSLLPILSSKIDTLDLSIRNIHCCMAENIYFVGDLVQKREIELSKTPNLGRKSLNEIKEVLAAEGLLLGMTLPNWVRPYEE